jgi:hypothetical protein
MFKQTSFSPHEIEKFKENYVKDKELQMNILNNRWMNIEGKNIPIIIIKTYYKQYCTLNEFFNETNVIFYNTSELKKRWDLLFNSERVKKLKILC